MNILLGRQMGYTRFEYLSDLAVHIIGMGLYGLSLAGYNIFPHSNWEWLVKRLDHSAIYLKIAGTFTGFAMLAEQAFLVVGAFGAAVVALLD